MDNSDRMQEMAVLLARLEERLIGLKTLIDLRERDVDRRLDRIEERLLAAEARRGSP